MGGIIETAGEVQLRLPAVWGHWTSTWFQIIHKSIQEYINNTQYPKSTHNSQKCYPKILKNSSNKYYKYPKYPKNLKMLKYPKIP